MIEDPKLGETSLITVIGAPPPIVWPVDEEREEDDDDESKDEDALLLDIELLLSLTDDPPTIEDPKFDPPMIEDPKLGVTSLIPVIGTPPPLVWSVVIVDTSLTIVGLVLIANPPETVLGDASLIVEPLIWDWVNI